MSKYGNRRVEADGYVFDSLAEHARYKELLLLEAAGDVKHLTIHPRYVLQPAFRDKRGRAYRAIVYEGDFSYTEVTDPQSPIGVCVVEDVKGVRTAVFRLKERLFRCRYPNLDLRIVEA